MKKICIGKITAAHGIKGYVKVISHTQYPEQLFDFTRLFLNNSPSSISKIGTVRNSFIVHIAGITDRNQAEAIIGQEFFIDRADLPEIDNDDEFYIEDLIGFTVINDSSGIIGKVTTVQNYGAGDILFVKDIAEKETLIPFDSNHILKVDEEKREISIQLPEEV
jgi:16S rRNA processing protein RimM